jgi:hypothetical protein
MTATAKLWRQEEYERRTPMNNDFIKTLKSGDAVIVSNNWDKSVKTVDKITPTGLIKVDGRLYGKDGYERTQDRCHALLMEATPEAIQAIEEAQIISDAMSVMRWTAKITYDQAVKILEILWADKP